MATREFRAAVDSTTGQFQGGGWTPRDVVPGLSATQIRVVLDREPDFIHERYSFDASNPIRLATQAEIYAAGTDPLLVVYRIADGAWMTGFRGDADPDDVTYALVNLGIGVAPPDPILEIYDLTTSPPTRRDATPDEIARFRVEQTRDVASLAAASLGIPENGAEPIQTQLEALLSGLATWFGSAAGEQDTGFTATGDGAQRANAFRAHMARALRAGQAGILASIQTLATFANDDQLLDCDPDVYNTDANVGAWSGGSNAAAAGGGAATATIPVHAGDVLGSTKFLKCTNAGGSVVPSGAIILGHRVEYKASHANGVSATLVAILRMVKGGIIHGHYTYEEDIIDSILGTTGTKPYRDAPATGASEEIAFLWEDTWLDSDVNASDSGVAIAFVNVGGGSQVVDVSLDHVRVITYYVVPA